MQKTTKRQKNLILQLQAAAQKEAKQQFQPVKTKMKRQIKLLQKNFETIEEDKVLTDAVNSALKEKLKSESEKAIIVEIAYKKAKQALQEENEKLKELNEGLVDKFNTLQVYMQEDDAKIKNLQQENERLKRSITVTRGASEEKLRL